MIFTMNIRKIDKLISSQFNNFMVNLLRYFHSHNLDNHHSRIIPYNFSHNLNQPTNFINITFSTK